MYNIIKIRREKKKDKEQKGEIKNESKHKRK